MSSKIEQIIDEIDAYIDSCKYQPLSNTKIIVNKEEIDELIRELRMKTPDEIKRYQKIITNKEAILNEAKKKAQELYDAALLQTNELISEHEVMQQAYAEANEVMERSARQAQEKVDAAIVEAEQIYYGAIHYADELLGNIENLLTRTINTAASHYESFVNQLNMYNDEIARNRMQLNPPEADTLSEEEMARFPDEEEAAETKRDVT